MLRLSQGAWAAIVAPALAISASMAASTACGESLPIMGEDVPDADGTRADTGDGEGSTDSGIDPGIDVLVDADAAVLDAPIEAGPPCTPDLPYGDPAPLDNFGALGAVSSVRPHHGGAPFAFVARDLGSGTF